MVHSSDKTHDEWHKFHLNNKNDYAAGYSDLISAMKDWSQHSLDHRLVYYALNFRPTRLVNSDTLTGFYDSVSPDALRVRILTTTFLISHPFVEAIQQGK